MKKNKNNEARHFVNCDSDDVMPEQLVTSQVGQTEDHVRLVHTVKPLRYQALMSLPIKYFLSPRFEPNDLNMAIF